MAQSTNLYPPLVNTYMPAYLLYATGRLYFSATSFNNISDIDHVQLALTYIDSNQSALNPNKWYNEIKLCQYTLDNSITTDYKYYINIVPGSGSTYADLANIGFAQGQVYKAQIRFSSVAPTGAASGYNTDPGATWLNTNAGYFSEWSRVCLIKGIPQPVINIRIPPSSGAYDGSSYFIAQYSNVDSSEPLLNYRARLYDTGGTNLIAGADTGIKTPDNTYQNDTQYIIDASGITGYSSSSIYNSCYFRFPVVLSTSTNYKLKFDYTTKSGYTAQASASLTTSITSATISGLTASGILDTSNGRIKIQVSAPSSGVNNRVVSIKRSDYTTNFGIWETVQEETIASGALNKAYYDYTIQSGVLYKYMVSGMNASAVGMGGAASDPYMVILNDMYLVGNNKQLCIKYNPKISTFKQVVLDSKVETLGGSYPYVRRNGNLKYREFDISGLISMLSDDNNLFTTDSELYGSYSNNYITYNTTNSINKYEDFIKEREFREKVLDFLNDGEVKLFKSTSEGNFIVKLTNISLSPVDTLGRMLYNFSATVTEIDSYTVDNCVKYSLQVS